MKKTALLLAAGAAALAASALDVSALKWRTTRFAKIEGSVLTVDVPADKASEGGMAFADIDLSEFDNMCFSAEISARGENISKPPQPWNGLKFMPSFTDASNSDRVFPNTPSRLGSFAQTNLTVRHAAPRQKRIKATLTLGLQESSGKVVFDLSTLKFTGEKSFIPDPVNQNFKVKYPESVRSLPLLRGVMLPLNPCKEDDFRTLSQWGATLARYQMGRFFNSIGKNRDLADFDKWLDGRLDHLEKDVLPWAGKYGIRIVVDLHVAPGGRDPDADFAMYHDPKYAAHFVECWRRIAKRFAGHPWIYGFDLINEPVQTRRSAPDCDYWNLQRRAAEAVRAIDPKTPIIIESNGWDSADTFTYLSPLAMDNVIYQVHMYQPGNYTHQGVGKGSHAGYTRRKYPDPAAKFDKSYIKSRLKPVLDFQRRHNVRIFVGEFSAISWAEGAGQYIADCIDVFEEYGWDWTYHAFREWQGWCVEHEAVGWQKFRPSASNPRKEALLSGMKRPFKPASFK